MRKRSLTAGFLTFWQIIVSLRLTFTIYHCTVAKQNCRLTKLRKSISNYIENTTSFFSFWEKKIYKKDFFFFKALFFSYKGQAFNTVAQIAYDLWSPSENKNPIKSEISWLRTGCLKTIFHHKTKVPRKLLSFEATKGCSIDCRESRVILCTLY